MLKVKIVYANDTRLWKFIKEKHTYQDLLDFVSSTFDFKLSSSFYLQFEDDENDRLTISTNIDFQDAIECAIEEKRKSLKIYVQNGSNSNEDNIYSCMQLRELMLDFLQNEEILKVLPDLIRNITHELKKQSSKLTAISIENIIRSILKLEKYEIVIKHKLYPKLDSMLHCFSKQIEKHSQILLNFSEDSIAAWIPHLIKVLLQFFTNVKYSINDEIQNTTNPMFYAFVPTWCAFMNQTQSQCNKDVCNDDCIVIHNNVTCDSCHLTPIRGARYKCCCCPNFDLCEKCETLGKHNRSHPLIKFQKSMNCAQRPFVGLHEMMMNFGHGPHHWFGHHWRRCKRKNQKPQQIQQKEQKQQQSQSQSQQMEGQHMMCNEWQHPWFMNNVNPHGYGYHHPPVHQQFNGWQQNNWRHRRNTSNMCAMNAKQQNVSGCGNRKLSAEFVCDVTLQDRSNFPMDTVLTKTWKMRNNGNYEWGTNVELVFFKGNETLTLEHRYPVINALPGQEVEISAVVKTPKTEGRYCAYYRLQKNGMYFGPRVWVDIFAVGYGDIPPANVVSEQKKNEKLMIKEICKLSKLEANQIKNEEKFIAKQSKLTKKMTHTHEKIRHMVDRFENIPQNIQQNVRQNVHCFQENVQQMSERVLENIEYVQKGLKNVHTSVRQGIIQKIHDFSHSDEPQVIQHANELPLNSTNVNVNADELPMLEEIANVVVDEVHRESIHQRPNNGRTCCQTKNENFSCVCGAPMVRTTPSIAYHSANVAVDCDACGKYCGISDCIFHCPRDRQAPEHPSGYDLCYNCMEFQMIVRVMKQEERMVATAPLFMSENIVVGGSGGPRSVISAVPAELNYVQSSNVIPQMIVADGFIGGSGGLQQQLLPMTYNNSMISHQFMYADALAQICSMGFNDSEMVRSLLIEHKGEVQRVVQLLLG